jgi:hypothetical protein
MNKTPSVHISIEFRSIDLGRVCLAAEADSKPAWQCRYQKKAISADLNGHLLAIGSSAKCHTRLGRPKIQSP